MMLLATMSRPLLLLLLLLRSDVAVPSAAAAAAAADVSKVEAPVEPSLGLVRNHAQVP